MNHFLLIIFSAFLSFLTLLKSSNRFEQCKEGFKTQNRFHKSEFQITDKSGKDDSCQVIFTRYSKKFALLKKRSFDIYFSHLGSNVSLKRFLDCSVLLINQGDRVVEDSIISFFEGVKNQLKRSNSLSYYHGVFETFAFTLGKISSKKAFNLGMEYFNIKVSVSDLIGEDNLGDYPDDHFGLGVFHSVILPMMHPNDKIFYWELFKKEYKKCLIRNSHLDNVDEVFRTQFYSRIKKDWEEGKIRLRE